MTRNDRTHKKRSGLITLIRDNIAFTLAYLPPLIHITIITNDQGTHKQLKTHHSSELIDTTQEHQIHTL